MLTPVGVSRSDYFAALKAGNRTHVKLEFPVQGVTLVDSDITLNGGLHLSTQMNPDTDLTIGKAISSEIQVELLNRGSVRSMLWTEEFTLSFGVEISGTTYWVQAGYFTGERPDKTLTVETVSFTAYDRMQLFEREAKDFLDSFTISESSPKTIRQIYQALCDFCYGVNDGSSYAASDDALSNIMGRSYTEFPFEGYGFTCRDLLAWIAEAAGCYAVIGADGKVTLRWFQEHMSDYSLNMTDWFTNDVSELAWVTGGTRKKWSDLEAYTWSQLSAYLWRELEGQKVPFKVNALKVSRTDVTGGDDVGVYIPDSSYAENIYQIVDNPFLETASATEETNYLVPLFNRLNLFGWDGVSNEYVPYIPMNVNGIGNWLIEAGDVIQVEIASGTYARFPIFCRTLSWSAGCEDNYVCTGSLERERMSVSNKQMLRMGGRYHIYRKDIDSLYSEIGDRTGKSTTLAQDINTLELKAQEIVATYRMDTDPRNDQTITLEDGDIWIDTSYVHAGATAYDNTATYDVGDYCTEDGKVYVCTVPITTAENFDPAHWDEDEPKNIWYQYDETNDAWISVADNTVYKRQSGIEIDVDGVKITGSKYVRIYASGGGAYWSYNYTGLTYYSGANQGFKIGSLTALQATAMSGIYDYIQIANSKNTTTLVSSYLVSGTLQMRYLLWEVENLDSGYHACLHASNSTAYLGDPSNLWEKSFLHNICGYMYAETTALEQYEINFTPGNSSAYIFLTETYAKNSGNRNFWFGPTTNVNNFTIKCTTCNQTSSREVKDNIRAIGEVGDIIDRLVPVYFNYKKDADRKNHCGLIYEDTEDVLPEICSSMSDKPEDKGIDYGKLAPILLREIQSLRKRVAELEAKEETK